MVFISQTEPENIPEITEQSWFGDFEDIFREEFEKQGVNYGFTQVVHGNLSNTSAVFSLDKSADKIIEWCSNFLEKEGNSQKNTIVYELSKTFEVPPQEILRRLNIISKKLETIVKKETKENKILDNTIAKIRQILNFITQTD